MDLEKSLQLLSSAHELSKQEVIDLIYEIENEILKLPSQISPPVEHFFGHKVYARQMSVPAGCIMTGRVPMQETIQFLIKGEISVLSPNGCVRLKAPCTYVGKVGDKKLGYTHSDVIWTTVYGTEETDHEVIFNTLTSNDPPTFEGE